MSAAITPHDAWLYMEFFNRGDTRLIQADDREAKTISHWTPGGHSCRCIECRSGSCE
jgi:hypothetical protein